MKNATKEHAQGKYLLVGAAIIALAIVAAAVILQQQPAQNTQDVSTTETITSTTSTATTASSGTDSVELAGERQTDDAALDEKIFDADAFASGSSNIISADGLIQATSASDILERGKEYNVYYGFGTSGTLGGKSITGYKMTQCQLGWKNNTNAGKIPFKNLRGEAVYLTENESTIATVNSSINTNPGTDIYQEVGLTGFKSIQSTFNTPIDFANHSNAKYFDSYFYFKLADNLNDGEKFQVVFMACSFTEKSTNTEYWFVDSVTLPAEVESSATSSSTTTSSAGSTTSTSSLESVVMHRYYNPTKGVHFYTDNTDAMSRFPTYEYEKEAFRIFPKSNAAAYAGNSDIVPVYRFYNPETGAHFYTANESQANRVKANYSPPFVYEGIKFYVYKADSNLGTELQKFFNPNTGAHFFTAFSGEINSLLTNPTFSAIFQDEGVAFRVISL